MTTRPVAVALFAILVAACGDKARTDQGLGEQGQIRVALNGEAADSQVSLVVRNVFDPEQVYLRECVRKDHALGGLSFCDELLVVPPGVYEIIAQSQDPTCRMTQDHYKVVVPAGQTAEVQIDMLCGAANGGLDVIVTESEQPVVQDISFTFQETGAAANKYVCRCGGDVRVELQVTDSDTACANLVASWSAVNGAGADVTSALLSDFQAVPGEPCRFSARVNANQPVDLYQVTFTVTDNHTPATSFTVPIHLIDCGNQCGSSLDVEKLVSPDNGLTWYDADQPPGPEIPAGTEPQFKYVLTNNGSTMLTLVSALDDVIGGLFVGGTWFPGDTFELIKVGTWAPGQQTNTVTFYGEDPDGNNVQDIDVANYVGVP